VDFMNCYCWFSLFFVVSNLEEIRSDKCQYSIEIGSFENTLKVIILSVSCNFSWFKVYSYKNENQNKEKKSIKI